MKLKIKPSAKIKRRYFLIEGASRDEVEKVILEYIGVLGWAKAGGVFVTNRGNGKGKVVLAVDRKEVNNVRAAFEVAETNVKILKVSGTLKGLRK